MSNVAYPFSPTPSGIPTQQLQTWSNQGSVTNAKNTREIIYNALKTDGYPWQDCEIYLQGSYGNDTNTFGNSDVDIVVEYKGVYFYDAHRLPLLQRQQFDRALSTPSMTFEQFHALTLRTLRTRFGSQYVSPGNKAIKVLQNGNRLAADVIPCFSYKDFTNWTSPYQNSSTEGIRFFTQEDAPSQSITNFPRQHRENATQKNAPLRTGGRYKPTLRMFKNARRWLVDHNLLDESVAPSYFVECLLFNVHDSLFVPDERQRYRGIVDALKSSAITNCISQNGIIPLFGPAPEQWDEDSARTLIDAWDYLWNNWGSL